MRGHPPRDVWTACGLGVLGGGIGGLSLLSFAGIFIVALIALLGGIALRPRPFGTAGVCVGLGVAWLSILAGAQARCDPTSCTPPDLTPWLAIAVGLLGAGTALVLAGIRRERRRPAG